MKSILFIYHDNCADGFASYMMARNEFGDDADYFACNYNSYSLELTADNQRVLKYKKQEVQLSGRDRIYVVDFSFKRNELNLISLTAGLVTVLDHHKTARAELMESDENGVVWHKHSELRDNIEVTFDMEQSGCYLFWAGIKVNMPFAYMLIGLRDVWKHKGTEHERDAEAMNMYVGLVGYNAESWAPLWDDGFTQGTALTKGYAILGFFNQKVKEATEHAIAVDQSKVVNAPYWMATELGNKLAETCDYAVIWSYANDGTIIVSLRSIGTKADVSAIAKKYNGGGHANAAGCKFTNFTEFQAAFLSS